MVSTDESFSNTEDAVIRHFEEIEGSRKIIANLAEGNDSDMERWIQLYTEMTGLDDEQKMTTANGIRRAVEVMRKNTGREPTTEQEQGKKVRFIEEGKEAQEVQERRKKIKRAREAHGRHEEDEGERPPSGA